MFLGKKVRLTSLKLAFFDKTSEFLDSTLLFLEQNLFF